MFRRERQKNGLQSSLHNGCTGLKKYYH